MIKDAVGKIFKRKSDGKTYTVWLHNLGIAWHQPAELWVKDAIFFHKHHSNPHQDTLMAIVKSKAKTTIERETNGQRARRVLTDRLGMWRGKTLDEMTDDECYECLRFVQEKTGVYYI